MGAVFWWGPAACSVASLSFFSTHFLFAWLHCVSPTQSQWVRWLDDGTLWQGAGLKGKTRLGPGQHWAPFPEATSLVPCLPPEPRTALKESEGESEGLNESAAWDVSSLVGGLCGPQRLSGLGGQSCPGVCFYSLWAVLALRAGSG